MNRYFDTLGVFVHVDPKVAWKTTLTWKCPWFTILQIHHVHMKSILDLLLYPLVSYCLLLELFGGITGKPGGCSATKSGVVFKPLT